MSSHFDLTAFRVDDEVLVRVLEVDTDRQRISLAYNTEALTREDNVLSADQEHVESQRMRTVQEGKRRKVSLNQYERNPKARGICLAFHGTRCAACGISLREHYGSIADGVIHVHHLKPLASIGEDYELDPVSDLRPICPNCHAVVHRRNPPFAIAEIKEFMRRTKERGRSAGNLR